MTAIDFNLKNARRNLLAEFGVIVGGVPTVTEQKRTLSVVSRTP